MTTVLIFLALLMFGFVAWVVSQSINVQPWVATPAGAIAPRQGIEAQPNSKVGLVVLIAVLTSLFALFMSAYVLRMELADWRPLQEPDLLWLNTVLLGLASVGMQWAYSKSASGDKTQIVTGLLVAGGFICLFIVGQLFAWRELSELGYYVTSNPANAFFYLLTALHIIHLLGGLVAWVGTMKKVLAGTDQTETRLSLQLSAVYIHFLLFVWLVLFALLLNT